MQGAAGDAECGPATVARVGGEARGGQDAGRTTTRLSPRMLRGSVDYEQALLYITQNLT